MENIRRKYDGQTFSDVDKKSLNVDEASSNGLIPRLVLHPAAGNACEEIGKTIVSTPEIDKPARITDPDMVAGWLAKDLGGGGCLDEQPQSEDAAA
ncbi:hypothetical protein [Burkholderia anthina]|uniref:hypothetical protein n=1 Tax=Burkholderia anthina TaxID=179879 RepID=UPI00158DCE94